MPKADSKLYLFIIWEKSRNKTEEILDDLRKKFVIRDVYQVKWSKENFLNNLRRFYGKTLPDAQEKAKVCGTGPFLVIIISDLYPKFDYSENMFEEDLVNSNINESKIKYRKWIGGDFTVHSSISDSETSHNLTLLFGKNPYDFEKDLPEEWNGAIKNLELDLIGHDGWNDMKQLLYVMNSTVNYVILRNFEGMPTEFDYHDVDILVNDEKLPYIVDKDFSSLSDNARSIEFNVGEKAIIFNPNYFGDHYYDERWEKDILKRRTFHPNGFYTPCKMDYFYTLLYHVTFHRRWKNIGKISDKYKKILSDLAKELDMNEITNKTFDDVDYSKKMIEEYMSKMLYRHPDTIGYKLTHGEHSRLIKSAIFIGRKEGMYVLLSAIIKKISVTINPK